MGIRLRDDVFFSNPESRIREYCEIEVYAGYDNQHPENNVIRFADLDAANNLYAMIDRYDKTESRRILDQSGKLSPLLSEIPNTPIFEFNDDEWTNIKSLVEKLLVKFVSIYGVGIAKATKILHLKRPELFPVLDSYVIQFLTGKNLSSSNRDVRLALQSLDTSKQLIQTQINEFKQLQNTVNDLPIPLTVVRLFDILCWSTYKWDIQRKTTAPRGKATKSLIEYKKTKPKINLKQVKTTFRSTKPKKKTALSWLQGRPEVVSRPRLRRC